jgi:hypothetical protein
VCLPPFFYTRVALYIFRYSQFSRLSFKSIKRPVADGDGRLVAFETAPGADNDEDRGQVQEFISAPPAEVKTRNRTSGGGMGFERQFNEPMGKISPTVSPPALGNRNKK